VNSPHFIDYRLLVMTKSPVLGTVKTRMQPSLSTEQSLALHCALLRQCLTQWTDAAICPIDLWVGGELALFQQQLPEFSALAHHVQCEGDLGNRMHHAIEFSFSRYSAKGVIVVGSDCPFIDAQYLNQAITKLQQGAPVVIGPANDGGYVLLGLSQPQPGLLSNIEWGSEQVFMQTLERCEQLNIMPAQLPLLSDIDHVDDLALLQAPHFSIVLNQFARETKVEQ